MSNNVAQINMQLVGAGSNELTVVGETTLTITIDNQDFKTTMVITKDLIQPLILGVKFLTENNGILDFSRQQIIFKKNNAFKEARAPLIPLTNAEQKFDSIGIKSVVFEDQMDTKCPTDISTTEFQPDREDDQSSMAYKLNNTENSQIEESRQNVSKFYQIYFHDEFDTEGEDWEDWDYWELQQYSMAYTQNDTDNAIMEEPTEDNSKPNFQDENKKRR